MIGPNELEKFSKEKPNNYYSSIITELLEEGFDPVEDFEVFADELEHAIYDGKVGLEDMNEINKWTKNKK